MRPIVQRSFIGQLAIRDFRDHHAVILHPQHAIVGHAPDGHGVQAPLLEHFEDFVLASCVRHDQHALLRFGEHDFVRSHAGFTLRHQAEVDLDAGFGATAHLASRACQPGRAHILNAYHRSGVHGFKARFEKQLLHERIADLDVGALFLRFLGENGRGHGGPVNPVAAGLRADVNHRVADSGGPAEENLVVAEHAEREHVHQRVAVVAGLEHAFAAHRGDAKTVAVMRDAADHTFQNAPVAVRLGRIGNWSEANRVQHGDRPCAHGEDVAQNAADAGGCSLKWLDEAGVVVRFDLEGDGVAVAYINDPGVFARSHQDSRALGRQLFQVQARALVGAMLAPHDGEDAFFGLVRFAAQDRTYFGDLRIGELDHAEIIASEETIGEIFSLAVIGGSLTLRLIVCSIYSDMVHPPVSGQESLRRVRADI